MIEQFTSPVLVNNSQELWLVGEGVVVSGGVAIPSLDLDFIGTNTLNSSVTFTRTGTGGTFFNSAGVLTAAAADQPRFDFNPATLAARGLLIEEARTNLLTYSEDLTQSAWTTNSVAVTPTANQAIAPDGNTTADIVVPTAVSSTHILRQFASVTSGTTYSGSWFVKAAGYSFVQITLSTGFDSGGALYRNFNLSTGANGNGNLPASQTTISSVGNGWYRITVTAASTLTTASGRFNLNVLDADTASANPTYTGDGTSGLYIWGAQLEAGAFPTSYIPTTTTALTRSADVASVNTLSPWYNSASGTLFAEVGYQQNTPSAAQIAASFNDTTANNRWTLGFGNTGLGAALRNTSGAGLITTTTANAATVGATNKTALAISTGASLVLNGGTVVTNASYAAPTVTQLQLGNQLAGVYFNGWLRRVSYYPRRFSDAELQAITA